MNGFGFTEFPDPADAADAVSRMLDECPRRKQHWETSNHHHWR